MASNLLKPRVPAGPRLRQIQDAKKMEEMVVEKCAKNGIDAPPYDLLELIGKGMYGRVYKSRRRENNSLVAVKIIEVDKQDYNTDVRLKDDTIKEFLREISILQSLKDSEAKNVNIIYDAFAVDTQLWIVSEYCPGGSLATLIKASPKKNNGVGCLEEMFIIPIAREVAVALKYVHDAGIIHRDIKCANILVTEDGRLQLCDFGVSGKLENGINKRTTIIGTVHWMAPELVPHLGDEESTLQYGTEIDCWAYGATVHEMATGFPPNHRVRLDQLKTMKHAPKLEGDQYSGQLKSFVSMCLEINPAQRPSAAAISTHPYIEGTEASYPTTICQQLLERFARWEESGNQRESLFNPHGAPGPNELAMQDEVDFSEWNFSMSEDFEKRISQNFDALSRYGATPQQEPHVFQKMMQEARIARGGHGLQRLFRADGDDNDDDFPSDLPFRNFETDLGDAGDRTTITMIDLDASNIDDGESTTLRMADMRAIRGKRGIHRDSVDDENSELTFRPNPNPARETKEWKFPTMEPPPEPSSSSHRATMQWTFDTATSYDTTRRAPEQTSSTLDSRPPLMHAQTMPARPPSPSRDSLIDLDSALDLDTALTLNIPSGPPNPPSIADSAISTMTSGDPFDLELPAPNNRGSLHMKSQSEPTAAFTSGKAPARAPIIETSDAAHNRSSSLSREPQPWDQRPRGHRRRIPQGDSMSSAQGSSQGSVRGAGYSGSSGGFGGPSVGFAAPARYGSPSRATRAEDIHIPVPRQPNMNVLLPGATVEERATELGGIYEDTARAAEALLALLQLEQREADERGEE